MLFTLLLLTSGFTSLFASTKNEFDTFINVYDKQYNSIEEYNKRWEIFSTNLQFITDHNSINNDWTMNVNEWADQTWDEFKQHRTSFLPDGHKRENNLLIVNNENVPDSIDWREHGVVTGVKNQGQCGSCWAFSTTGSVESAMAIATGNLTSLSEQELVDCDSTLDHGCQGGLMDNAFKWIKKNGLCTEEDYPYTAQNDKCRKGCDHVAKVKNIVDIPANDEKALKLAVSKQPVSVAIEADQPGFQFYHRGVFTGTCGTRLDHGVLVVGYGSENGVDYWIVKNSWGSSWGDNGYIRLKRSDQRGESGQCGIAMMASYPVVI